MAMFRKKKTERQEWKPRAVIQVLRGLLEAPLSVLKMENEEGLAKKCRSLKDVLLKFRIKSWKPQVLCI